MPTLRRQSDEARNSRLGPTINALVGSVDSFVNTVFPPLCAICKRIGTLLCDDCRRQLPLASGGPICARCGRHTTVARLSCRTCRAWPAELLQVSALFRFVGDVPGLIHQFKYEGQFALARPFGEMMAAHWVGLNRPVDLIIPIPLHAKRQRTRGYNQAALIARSLAAVQGWTLEEQLLRRTRHTRSQVGLEASERQKNLASAFELLKPSCQGAHVLLVDDVCTTGATLVTAANTLLAGGAAAVSGYCVARAQ